jgi:hypothetical protein
MKPGGGGGVGEIIGASAVVTEVRITYVMGFPVVVVVMESDS